VVARRVVAGAAAEIAAAAARDYQLALCELSRGAPRMRFDSAFGNPNLEDLFRRSQRDLQARAELEELTEIADGRRRLRRGQPDSGEPTWQLQDLPGFARQALERALPACAGALVVPPPQHLEILDAARELGSGVASWPRIRILVLVRGPSDSPDDDLVLEVKEIVDSAAAGWAPPQVYFDDLVERVRRSMRAIWYRPDAATWWSACEYLGLPFQLRQETEAHKTLRVARMVDARGTRAALRELAGVLGRLLARVHATPLRHEPSPAAALCPVLEADPDGFAAEQGEAAAAYAEQVQADWAIFREALDELGPSLGIAQDPSDLPGPDVQALLGRPAQPAGED
jgi:hypothetical protein